MVIELTPMEFTPVDFVNFQFDVKNHRYGKGTKVSHEDWKALVEAAYAFIKQRHEEGIIDASSVLKRSVEDWCGE